MNWNKIHTQFPEGDGYFYFEIMNTKHIFIYHFPHNDFYKSTIGYGVFDNPAKNQFKINYDPCLNMPYKFGILTTEKFLSSIPKFRIRNEGSSKFLAEALYWTLTQ